MGNLIVQVLNNQVGWTNSTYRFTVNITNLSQTALSQAYIIIKFAETYELPSSIIFGKNRGISSVNGAVVYQNMGNIIRIDTSAMNSSFTFDLSPASNCSGITVKNNNTGLIYISFWKNGSQNLIESDTNSYSPLIQPAIIQSNDIIFMQSS